MTEWFITDEHKAKEFEWHVVDPATLLAVIEVDVVVLPEDWKVIYGSIQE